MILVKICSDLFVFCLTSNKNNNIEFTIKVDLNILLAFNVSGTNNVGLDFQRLHVFTSLNLTLFASLIFVISDRKKYGG